MSPARAAQVKIAPANKSSWDDLETILGGRGDSAGCWCQRFKMSGRDWYYKGVPVHARAEWLRAQTNCGKPRAKATTGLVAYLDGEPVGWCNVEPRARFVRLGQAPWTGRNEDPADPGIWAVTCFVVRTGFRRRHITYALARAAVAFARERGARALEGYAMITQPGKDITWGELHVGPIGAFVAAGFAEVHRPSKRRVVMRIDFGSRKSGGASTPGRSALKS